MSKKINWVEFKKQREELENLLPMRNLTSAQRDVIEGTIHYMRLCEWANQVYTNDGNDGDEEIYVFVDENEDELIAA